MPAPDQKRKSPVTFQFDDWSTLCALLPQKNSPSCRLWRKHNGQTIGRGNKRSLEISYCCLHSIGDSIGHSRAARRGHLLLGLGGGGRGLCDARVLALHLDPRRLGGLRGVVQLQRLEFLGRDRRRRNVPVARSV